MSLCVCQASSSSDSLDGPSVDYAKSYDAVVFDVLKVTPEEFAVSVLQMLLSAFPADKTDQITPERFKHSFRRQVISLALWNFITDVIVFLDIRRLSPSPVFAYYVRLTMQRAHTLFKGRYCIPFCIIFAKLVWRKKWFNWKCIIPPYGQDGTVHISSNMYGYIFHTLYILIYLTTVQQNNLFGSYALSMSCFTKETKNQQCSLPPKLDFICAFLFKNV